VLDRQDLHPAETCLVGISLQRLRAQHGAGSRRRLFCHASRQAVQDAEAVQHLFQRFGAGLEGNHLASQEFSCLPALGGLCRELLEDLRLRWPDQAGGMNPYPAFISHNTLPD
jgi:hypothetical protein